MQEGMPVLLVHSEVGVAIPLYDQRHLGSVCGLLRLLPIFQSRRTLSQERSESTH